MCQGPGAGFAQPGCLVNKELFGLTSIPGSPMETGSESPGDEASRDKFIRIYILKWQLFNVRQDEEEGKEEEEQKK